VLHIYIYIYDINNLRVKVYCCLILACYLNMFKFLPEYEYLCLFITIYYIAYNCHLRTYLWFCCFIQIQIDSTWEHKSWAVAHMTTLCTVAPNSCGLSVGNLLCVTLLVHRIFRLLLDFWEICGPLDYESWETVTLV
jgi:ABC-type proline/glycine betaine transport system permease subunit